MRGGWRYILAGWGCLFWLCRSRWTFLIGGWGLLKVYFGWVGLFGYFGGKGRSMWCSVNVYFGWVEVVGSFFGWVGVSGGVV